jgi:transcriptional regulator with XRE-family HTH domain
MHERSKESAVRETSSNGAARRGKNLDLDQVRVIAERIAEGERHAAIAEDFGVSVQTIRAIKSGKRWAGAIDEVLRARMQEASSRVVLDAEGARGVMAALEVGRPGRSIAREFGISPSMVSAIKHGQSWSALDAGLVARLDGKPRQGKALSASQVAKIKRRLLEGGSSRKVAAEFGVSASTIIAIAQGRTWSEVAPADAE